MDLFEDFELISAAAGDGRSGPFAHAVHGKHGGFVKRRAEECAGGMALVMLGEEELLRSGRTVSAELLDQHVLLKELFANPHGNRHAERLQSARRKREVSFEETLEFQKRLVVEGDVIDVREGDAGL